MHFEEGEYVVLLKSCDGANCWHDSFPVDHVYKLRKNADRHQFYPELDTKLSKNNGWWGTGSYHSRMEIRKATESERRAYEAVRKPIHIDDVVDFVNSYEIF
jgi:hypothetical protein